MKKEQTQVNTIFSYLIYKNYKYENMKTSLPQKEYRF